MKAWLLAFAVAAAPSWSAAHDFDAGDLAIIHPFVRATPPGVQNGAGYMTVANDGTEPDRLIAIETPAAARVEFHQTVVTDGIARMQPVTQGFLVQPGGTAVIGAKGTHAMLVGLTGRLIEGETIEGTLVFERAGRIPIVFEVEPIGTPTEGHRGDHGQ